jgi:hypothetical protein
LLGFERGKLSLPTGLPAAKGGANRFAIPLAGSKSNENQDG